METAYATAVSAFVPRAVAPTAASTSRIVMMKTGCAIPVPARVGIHDAS